MRVLKRNRQLVYYANFLGKAELVDENGFRTGEYDSIYTPPKKTMANVSAARGESGAMQFGEILNYDKAVVTENETIFDGDEYSVFWIDSDPAQKPPDFTVVRVAKSLNFTAVALRKTEDHQSAIQDDNLKLSRYTYEQLSHCTHEQLSGCTHG